MCKKAKCAYLRSNGYCLMHKDMCNIPLPDCRCADGAARAIPSKTRHLWEVLEESDSYDLGIAKGRMQYYTRKANRGVVFSQCGRKARYPDLKRATEVLRMRMHSGSVPLRAYHCPFCGGYHLTHKVTQSKMVLSCNMVYAA